MFACGCEPSPASRVAKVRANLAAIEETTIDDLVTACRDAGTDGISLLREFVGQSNNEAHAAKTLVALLVCSPTSRIEHHLESVSASETIRSRVYGGLKGRMTIPMRDELTAIVGRTSGGKRAAGMHFLGLVADTPAALEVAKRVLAEPNLSVSETIPALYLLGEASYHNEDASCLDLAARHFSHEVPNVRLFALAAIHKMPTDEAVTVLQEAVAQGICTESTFARLLAGRAEAFEHGIQRPLGYPAENPNKEANGE